jgi:RNA polymerase sigma factor (sigma-70 family)
VKNPEITDFIAALRDGDPAARRELFRDYLPPLHRRAVRLLGSSGDAYDVAAGLLLDFMEEYVHGFTGQTERSLRGYLKTAVVRRGMAFRERAAALPGDAHEQELSVGMKSNDPLLLARLEACLDELPPRARQILRLKFAGDRDNVEIGRLLGQTRASISKQLIHPQKGALARLRRCIGRRGSAAATGERS